MRLKFISIIITFFTLLGCEKDVPTTEEQLLGSWRAIKMEVTYSEPYLGYTIIYGSLDTNNYRRFYYDDLGTLLIEHENGFITHAILDGDYMEEYFFLGPTRSRQTILWHIEKLTSTKMVVTNNLGTGRTWIFEKF